MKFINETILQDKGEFTRSEDRAIIINEIKASITLVDWPDGSGLFTINPGTPSTNRPNLRAHGNGVLPIKKNCMNYLHTKGWLLEHYLDVGLTDRPGPIDAIKRLENDEIFALEWETGNVSSSHRALNKIMVGLLNKKLIGGTLIVPTINMAAYLTERIGNFEEISPYFQVWRSIQLNSGFLSIIAIEHDAISMNVPFISKGSDGLTAFNRRIQS